MTQKEVTVKTGGKIVATILVDQFSTLEELQSSVTEEEILAMCNRQLVEDKRNAKRVEFQPTKQSRLKRQELGFSIAFKLFKPELEAAIAEGKMNEFIQSDKVQAAIDELLQASEE